MGKTTTKTHGAAAPILRYEAITVGDEAPVVSHKLTRTDLVRYAGASGDFNPMHTDEVAAKEAGLPSVFGHGMFSMGLLGRAVTDWAGAGNLKVYGVRFTRQTWPGKR
ncbi:MAG: MaoC/PaaZ C-terminal domain-containing protein [Halioglobus sp.]